MKKGPDLKYGIFSWFGYVMPLPERLRLIREAGFAGTSLWWEDEVGYPVVKKEIMPQLVRESGLILENVHVPYSTCNNLWSDSVSARKAEVRKHITWVEDCVRYGIPVMVMHVTDGPRPPAFPQYGVESMTSILEAAEQAGVVIAVENTDHMEYIRYLFSRIQSRFLGLCYDSSHDRLYNPDHPGVLTELGGRLIATHLSDNDGLLDRHWLPGEGVIDWKKIGEAFPWSSYGGWLTLEVCAQGMWQTKPPLAFLKAAYTKAKTLAGELTGKDIETAIV